MAKKFLRNKVTDEVRILDTVLDASEITSLTGDKPWIGTPADLPSGASDWEDVTPSAGGGSAFAHLTEDAGTSRELVDDAWSIGWGDAYLRRLGAGRLALSTDTTLLVWDADDTKETVLRPGQVGAYGDTTAAEVGQWGVVGEDANRLVINGDGSLHWGDGTAAPDVHLQRANGFNALLLVDPDYSGFNVSELDDFSTQSSQMTPDTVQTADAGANTFASLSATGQVVISAHSTVRHLTVDADGDLAIIGVGKVSTH